MFAVLSAVHLRKLILSRIIEEALSIIFSFFSHPWLPTSLSILGIEQSNVCLHFLARIATVRWKALFATVMISRLATTVL